jgi:predicted amidophosphoribosyltransferase
MTEGFCPNCHTEVDAIEHSRCEVCGRKLQAKQQDKQKRYTDEDLRRIYADLQAELKMLSDDAGGEIANDIEPPPEEERHW